VALSNARIGEAQAGVEVESVQVVYDADVSCPGRSKFVEELTARTPKVAVSDAGHAKRTFVVTLRPKDAGFVGRLEIQAGEPTATTREITGQSCAAVVSAVALVAALAVDPDSLRGDAPDKPAPSSTPAPPVATNAIPLASPPAKSASLIVETPDKRDWTWAIGAKAETNSVIAPHLSFGAGVFVELEAVRLVAHYAVTGTIQQDTGSAHFDWAALSLEGCPARPRWGAVGLDLCGAFAGGVLRGHGDDVPAPLQSFQAEDPLRPWWSVAPLLRVSWALSRSWSIEAEGSLVIPLRRDTFVFKQPERRVFYEVPTLGAAAGLGIGYRFDDRKSDRRP